MTPTAKEPATNAPSWGGPGPTAEATGTKAGGGGEVNANDDGAQNAVATSAAAFETMTLDD